MSDRKIGRVISVDSFRVVVQLDSDLKSLYKSGFEDIYEIARINSYLIIPVGADRIVALITRVKIQDETEIEKTSGSITLPRAERYLVATMIGTIENRDNEFNYIQGVYNFPILDNPVWHVTKDDLDRIFDTEKKDKINLDKDYYLPVGNSAAFSNYKIRINPDKFFGKHAAILGNTGSGKSCTVAAILQSLFSQQIQLNKEEKKEVKNAHIIIFDTNGEYKQAFISDSSSSYANVKRVNPFVIDRQGIKIPYWFMNYDDYEYLFEPGSGTQAPILKRAIGLAKDNTVSEMRGRLTKFIEKGILELLECSSDELKKKKKYNDFGNWKYKDNNEVKGLAEAIEEGENESLKKIKESLSKLGSNCSIKDENETIIELRELYANYQKSFATEQVALDANIDLPIWFEYEKLITEYFDQAIKEQESSSNRIREFVSTLRLRLQSYYHDERISSPLILKGEKVEESLAKFLAFVFGDYLKVYSTDSNADIFSDYYEKLNQKIIEYNKDGYSQITIIDLSLISFEVLETITGLIGRLILEFLSRFSANERGLFPSVIILEEAQNYIPEFNRTSDKISISKRVFERIAREGRKYGLSLIVSSQRPSELSKTVLSQCNSFIIHRLQNPEDQKYVRQLVSAANEDILQQLPILPQQHAIIMGDAVRSPIQLKITNANPKPNSDNPKFISKWLEEPRKEFPDYKKIAKDWEEGKRISE